MTFEEIGDTAILFSEFMKAKTIIERMKVHCVYDKRYGDLSCYFYKHHTVCYDLIKHCISVFEPISINNGSTRLMTEYKLRDYGMTWAMSKEELE